MGDPRCGDRQPREPGLRAARGRVPGGLVPERDQHRRPEVLPRPARLARARVLGQTDDRPGRGDDLELGARGRLLRLARGRRRLRGRAGLDPAQPEGGLQLAGLVQRRLRGDAAVLGLPAVSRACLDARGHGPDRRDGRGGADRPRGVRRARRDASRRRQGQRPQAGDAGAAAQRRLRRSHAGSRRQGRRRAPHRATVAARRPARAGDAAAPAPAPGQGRRPDPSRGGRARLDGA